MTDNSSLWSALTDPDLRQMLSVHEAVKRTIYDDATGQPPVLARRRPDGTLAETGGNVTVGIGYNLSANGISSDVLDLLYRESVGAAVTALTQHCPWFNGLDLVRRRAVIDMCFNLGWTKLAEFRDFLHAMEEHAYEDAAHAMLDSAWARELPRRAQSLADMVRTGQMAG